MVQCALVGDSKQTILPNLKGASAPFFIVLLKIRNFAKWIQEST
ncbi:MAG: hypothetical protein RL762_1600 [Bacteroidota bacterium]|jgi:hypothetical protein